MFADEENRTKIKICGITNLQDARFVAGALADYIGFIFYEKSPRYISPSQAGAIINWLEGPQPVGVFVNESADTINDIITQTGIDYVQLHGNEPPEFCSLINKPVIKALHISEDTKKTDLLKQVEAYMPYTEYLLFDTKIDGLWGGTGTSFDWNMLSNLKEQASFFLSGGLNPKNVKEACKKVQPYAVDISSGVEAQPGKKDFNKLNHFFETMRDVHDLQEMGNL